MRKFLVALPVVALTFGSMAFAEGLETVKERQAYFKSLGGSMKVMAELAKSFDADAAKAEAPKLEAILATDAAPLFAPGTSDEDFPGETRAMAKIWSNMDDFGAKGEALHEAGATLVAAANAGDAAEFGKAVGAFGGACKACHDDYRLPE